MGSPGPTNLSSTQIAFYRAGHAHAGVLTLLAMLLQIAVDYAALPSLLVWPVRVGAIAASILVSGGFFAVAHRRSLHIILYTGAVLVAATTLRVGVALKFYTQVLGFQKKREIPVGTYKWLTVVSPEGPDDLELSLEPNANPAARTFQEAMFAQSIPLAAFEVADIQKEYARLKASYSLANRQGQDPSRSRVLR